MAEHMSDPAHKMTTTDSDGSKQGGMGPGGMDGREGMKMEGSRMMTQYFHFSVKEYILLQACFTQSAVAMVGACIFSCMLAIAFESLRYLRCRIPAGSPKISPSQGIEMKTSDEMAEDETKHHGGSLRSSKTNTATPITQFPAASSVAEKTDKAQSQLSMSVVRGDERIHSCRHVIISTLYIVEALISYCLMMIVMTFNLWLYLAVGVGAAIGYFLFGMRNVVLTSPARPKTENQQLGGEEGFI